MTSSRNLPAQTSQTHISQLAHFLHQEARVLLLANLNDTTGTIKNGKVWVLWKLTRLQNFDICTLQIFLTSVLCGNKFKILVYKLFWLCEPNLLFCLDFNCVVKPPQLPELAQTLKKNWWKKSEYYLSRLCTWL